MAVSKRTDIQELLQKNHEMIPDAIQDPKYSAVFALMQKVKGVSQWKGSRVQRKYFGIEVVPEGVSGPITEASPALHSAEAGDAIEPYMDEVTLQGTLGFSGHELAQLEAMDTEHAILRVGKRMTRFAQRERLKLSRYFMGRGKGAVARANAAGDGTSFVAVATAEFLPVRGQLLTGYTTRDKAASDNGGTLTGWIGDTSVKVRQIKSEDRTIIFDRASTWSDNAVLVNSAGATNEFPTGLMNHLDNVSDTDFMWDTEDGTADDHLDTYLGLARSTNPELECLTYKGDGALFDLNELGHIIARCEAADPGSVKRLVGMYHPEMRRKLVDSFQSGVRFTRKDVFLAGGKTSLAVLTGTGDADIPMIQDYGIPNGMVAVVDSGKGRMFKVKGMWLNGGKPELLPQASVAGHLYQYVLYYVYQTNFGWFMPNSSCVGYNFDTN